MSDAPIVLEDLSKKFPTSTTFFSMQEFAIASRMGHSVLLAGNNPAYQFAIQSLLAKDKLIKALFDRINVLNHSALAVQAAAQVPPPPPPPSIPRKRAATTQLDKPPPKRRANATRKKKNKTIFIISSDSENDNHGSDEYVPE